MDMSSLAEIIPAWASSSGSGGVSVSANVGCGAVLAVATQIKLASSDTVSLAQKKYGELSTYLISRYRWKLMRVS